MAFSEAPTGRPRGGEVVKVGGDQLGLEPRAIAAFQESATEVTCAIAVRRSLPSPICDGIPGAPSSWSLCVTSADTGAAAADAATAAWQGCTEGGSVGDDEYVEDDVCVALPPEVAQPGVCAKLCRSLCGARAAPARREALYTASWRASGAFHCEPWATAYPHIPQDHPAAVLHLKTP